MIDHSAPYDALGINAQGFQAGTLFKGFIAFTLFMEDSGVQCCRTQVMGAGNSVDVTSQMQVEIFHGNNLGITTTGCTTLDAEDGTHAGLADTADRLLANGVQAHGDRDGINRLAFTERCRSGCCDQNHTAIGTILQVVNGIQADLGLVVAIGFAMLLLQAELICQLSDMHQIRISGDFNIRLHFVIPLISMLLALGRGRMPELLQTKIDMGQFLWQLGIYR